MTGAVAPHRTGTASKLVADLLPSGGQALCRAGPTALIRAPSGTRIQVHKILAMVAVSIISTLTTSPATSNFSPHHTRALPQAARFIHKRQGEPSPLTFSAVKLTSAAASVLSLPGSFAELRHPWRNLVRLPRIEARRARAAAAAVTPVSGYPAGAAAAAHLSATGFEGCVMAAESHGVPQAWWPGHTDGSLPSPNSPVAEGLFGFLLSTWRGLGLGYSEGASFAPARVQIKGFWKLYDSQGTAPWSSDGCAGGSAQMLDAVRLMAAPAVRHHRSHARWIRWVRAKAMKFAISQRGKPYEWGETGPYGYDCSGLVYASYRHARVYRIGRATYDMLAQVGGLLRRVWHPVRGDLAFFPGGGHVELYAGHFRGHSWTFGALHSGTLVGRHMITPYWGPVAYYEVV